MVYLVLGSIGLLGALMFASLRPWSRRGPQQQSLIFLNGRLMVEGGDADYILSVHGEPIFNFQVGLEDKVQRVRLKGTLVTLASRDYDSRPIQPNLRGRQTQPTATSVQNLTQLRLFEQLEEITRPSNPPSFIATLARERLGVGPNSDCTTRLLGRERLADQLQPTTMSQDKKLDRFSRDLEISE